jgi:hypothetical protein
MLAIAGRTAPAVDCADAPLEEVEQLLESSLRRLAAALPKP